MTREPAAWQGDAPRDEQLPDLRPDVPGLLVVGHEQRDLVAREARRDGERGVEAVPEVRHIVEPELVIVGVGACRPLEESLGVPAGRGPVGRGLRRCRPWASTIRVLPTWHTPSARSARLVTEEP